MREVHKPTVRHLSAAEKKYGDYVKISFSPDLQQFKMDKLDTATYGLFTKRAYDVAGTMTHLGGKLVTVTLNGKELPNKSFKEYLDVFENVPRPVEFATSKRWEVGVGAIDNIDGVNDTVRTQISFVNTIHTKCGGAHVSYIADQIAAHLIQVLKTKRKGRAELKKAHIVDHLFIMVNCWIENPSFDSHAKDKLITTAKSFGSEFKLSPEFLNSIEKSEIVDYILSSATQKEKAAESDDSVTKALRQEVGFSSDGDGGSDDEDERNGRTKINRKKHDEWDSSTELGVDLSLEASDGDDCGASEPVNLPRELRAAIRLPPAFKVPVRNREEPCLSTGLSWYDNVVAGGKREDEDGEDDAPKHTEQDPKVLTNNIRALPDHSATQDVIEILDDNDDDDEQKPKALPKPAVQVVIVVDDSSDEDDDNDDLKPGPKNTAKNSPKKSIAIAEKGMQELLFVHKEFFGVKKWPPKATTVTSNVVTKQGVRFTDKDLNLSTKEANLVDGSVVGVAQPARARRVTKKKDKYAYDPDYVPESREGFE
jgi:DNA gyrase B